VALSAGGAATGIFIAAALVRGLAFCAFLLGPKPITPSILLTLSKSSAQPKGKKPVASCLERLSASEVGFGSRLCENAEIV